MTTTTNDARDRQLARMATIRGATWEGCYDPRDRQLARMAVVQAATWSEIRPREWVLRNAQTDSMVLARVTREGSDRYDLTVYATRKQDRVRCWALGFQNALDSAREIAMKLANRGLL